MTTMNLKLTGIASYTGAACKGINIVKNDVARFDVAIAKRLLKSSRVNREGDEQPYFTEVGDDVAVKYDLSSAPKQGEPEAPAPETSAVVKRSSRGQRAGATA